MENPTLPTNWLAALSNANHDGTTQFPCIAVGTGTWGIAAVIPKYLLPLHPIIEIVPFS